MAKKPNDTYKSGKKEQDKKETYTPKKTTKVDLAKSESEVKAEKAKNAPKQQMAEFSDFALETPKTEMYSEEQRRMALLGGRDPYSEYKKVSRKTAKMPVMAMEMSAPFVGGVGRGVGYLGKQTARLGNWQKSKAISKLTPQQRQLRAADFANQMKEDGKSLPNKMTPDFVKSLGRKYTPDIAPQSWKESEYIKQFSPSFQQSMGERVASMGGGMGGLGDAMQGTAAGAFQTALGSTSTVRGIERARMLNREKNLGVSGGIYRGTNFLRTANKAGYSANLLATMAGAGSGTMGSLTGMLGGGLMGMGGLKLLSAGAGFLTMRKIAIRRKSYTKEQRKHSIAPMIEQQMQMLISTGQLKPVDQMKIQLLTRIESNSVFSALMWEMMDLEKQKEEKNKNRFDTNYGENIHGKQYDSNPIVKSFENLNAQMNKFIIKFDPIAQLTSFLLTGKTPKKTLEQINQLIGDTRKDKESMRKEQIVKGIRADQIRLMKIDAMTLISSSYSTEEKQMALMMGQYDLTRLIAQETMTMRKGMGIDNNAFFEGVEYKKGVFGRMINGIVGGITAVPGINALSNIFKTVIKLPQSIAGAYKGAIRGGKNLLFGKQYTDLQDPKELDKQLGLYKPLERKADEFIAKGLPTELKSQTMALYEQLTVQKNIYEVASLMYKLQTKGMGEHQYDDDMYKAHRDRTFWDSTEGRYLDKDAIDVLEDTREDKRTFALESAFRKGLISKLTMDIPGLTKKENIRTDEERMNEYTEKMREKLKSIGDVEDTFGNQELTDAYKSKRKMEMMPTTGIEDELFSIERERYLRNMEENFANKWGFSKNDEGKTVAGRNLRSAGWGLTSLLGTAGAGALTVGTGGLATLLPLMFGGAIAGNASRPFTTSRKNWADTADAKAEKQFEGDERISSDGISGSALMYGRKVKDFEDLLTRFKETEKDDEIVKEQYDIIETLKNMTEQEHSDTNASMLDVMFHLQQQREELSYYFTTNQDTLNQIRLNYNALTNKTNFLLENIAQILELNIADTLLDHSSKIDRLIDIANQKDKTANLKDRSDDYDRTDIIDSRRQRIPNIRDLINSRSGMADDYDQEELKAASKGGRNFKKALVGEHISPTGEIKGYPEIVVGNFDVLGQKETRKYLNGLGIKTLAKGDIEIAQRPSGKSAITNSWIREIVESSGSGKDIERSISGLIHEIRVNVFGRTIGTIRRLVGQNLNPEEVENEIADDGTINSMFKGKKWAKLGWDLGEDFGIVGRLTGAIIGGSIGGITDWLGSEKLQKVKEKATNIGSKVIEKTAGVFKSDSDESVPPIMAFRNGGIGKGLGLVGERFGPGGSITGSPQLIDGEYGVIGQDKTREILDALDFETLKGGTSRLSADASIREILLASYIQLEDIQKEIKKQSNAIPFHGRQINPVRSEQIKEASKPTRHRTVQQELEEVKQKRKEKEEEEYRYEMLRLLAETAANTKEDKTKVVKEEERDKKKTGALGMLAGIAPKLGGLIMKMGPALTAFAGIYSFLKLKKDWENKELTEQGTRTITKLPALIRDIGKNTPGFVKKPFQWAGSAVKGATSLGGRAVSSVGKLGANVIAGTSDKGFDLVNRARGLTNRVGSKSSILGKAGEMLKIGKEGVMSTGVGQRASSFGDTVARTSREGLERVTQRTLGTNLVKNITSATKNLGDNIATQMAKASDKIFDVQFAARGAKKRLMRHVPNAITSTGKMITDAAQGALKHTRAAGSTIKNVAESSPVMKSLGSIMSRAGARIGIKAGAKAGTKTLPLLGFAASFGFGAKRLEEGDYVGAARELASGAVSLIPFVGAGASIGMDIVNAKRVSDRKKQGLNKGGRLGAWLYDKTHKSDDKRKEELRKEMLEIWKKKMSPAAYKLLDGDHTQIHELREQGLILRDKDDNNIFKTVREMGISPEDFEKRKVEYERQKAIKEKKAEEKRKAEAEKEEVRKIVNQKADSKEDLQKQILQIWKRKMSPAAFELLEGDYTKARELRAKGLIIRDQDGILKTIKEVEGKTENVKEQLDDASKKRQREKEKKEIQELINDKTSDPEKLEKQILEIWRRNMSRDAFKLIDGDHKKVAELRAKGLIVRHEGKWKLISEISDKADTSEIEKMQKKIKLDELKNKMSEEAYKLLNNEPTNFTNILKEGKIKRTWFGLGPYDLTWKGRRALEVQQEALRQMQGRIGEKEELKQMQGKIGEKEDPKQKELKQQPTAGTPYGVPQSTTIPTATKEEQQVADKKVKMPYAPSPLSTVAPSEPLAGNAMQTALETIIKQEGHYGSVNKDDAGKGVSIGKLQWHGDRARDLLRQLQETDPEKFKEIMGEDMVDLISKDDVSWHGKTNKVTFNKEQSNRFNNLMQDAGMKKTMDNLAVKDFQKYVDRGKKLGIEDPKALAYFADVANQYGMGGASKRFRNVEDKSLEGLHNVMKDTKYASRRKKVYKAVKNLPAGTQKAVQNTQEQMQKTVEDQKKAKAEKVSTGKTTGSFSWPAQNNIITSPYGPRKVKKGSQYHRAMDVRANTGDPIFSVLPGVVLPSSERKKKRWGEVKIDHGDFVTRYLHNSEIMVDPGQEITQGQQIAKAGGLGYGKPKAFVPHLHFEVQKNGQKLDPEMFLHNMDPSWTPKYAADIHESRHLNSRLKGKKPEVTKPDPKDSGEYGLNQTSWLTDAKNRVNALQNTMTQMTDTVPVSSANPQQPITVNKNSPIIVNPDTGNKTGESQLDKDENFTKIDRKLDELVNQLFNNVCGSFDNIVGNYAFGSSNTQQFF